MPKVPEIIVGKDPKWSGLMVYRKKDNYRPKQNILFRGGRWAIRAFGLR